VLSQLERSLCLGVIGSHRVNGGEHGMDQQRRIMDGLVR
jgi:hypothetical protein